MKARYILDASLGDGFASGTNIDWRIVLQPDACRLDCGFGNRIEDITAMTGCDIENMCRVAGILESCQGEADKLLQMQLALTNAPPADRIQELFVDKPAARSHSSWFVLIDVVEG